MSREDTSDTFNTNANGFRCIPEGSKRSMDHLLFSIRLDPKTSSLIRIGIAASQGSETGMPLHVALARDAGATRDEIVSAIMLGLPPGCKREVPGSIEPLDSRDIYT